MAVTDEAVWGFEERLWTEGGAVYPELVSPDAVVATPGMLMTGKEATEAMRGNPGWKCVTMGDRRLARSGRDVIVISYRAHGVRPDSSTYDALCTSTYHASGDDWQLLQHSQTVTN